MLHFLDIQIFFGNLVHQPRKLLRGIPAVCRFPVFSQKLRDIFNSVKALGVFIEQITLLEFIENPIAAFEVGPIRILFQEIQKKSMKRTHMNF